MFHVKHRGVKQKRKAKFFILARVVGGVGGVYGWRRGEAGGGYPQPDVDTNYARRSLRGGTRGIIGGRLSCARASATMAYSGSANRALAGCGD